jgi:hypothetical protein
MGVDCNIRLPLDVPIDEVGEVVAALAGVSFKVDEFSAGGSDQRTLRVARFDKNNLEYVPSKYSPGMFDIILKNKKGLADGEDTHTVYFFHCSHDCLDGKVYNVMSPHSTPFWCAMGKRLVEFFGGVVVFSDCDSEKGKNVYRRKRSCPVDKWGRIPSDGKVWQEYQDAIINMPKVSEKELREAWGVAAYRDRYDPKTGRYVPEAEKATV